MTVVASTTTTLISRRHASRHNKRYKAEKERFNREHEGELAARGEVNARIAINKKSERRYRCKVTALGSV